MTKRLRKTIKNAPIITKGTYAYLVHPLFDGFPAIDPSLLQEVVEDMEQLITPYLPFDRIITVESMGIPLTTILSHRLNIPYTIIRKRQYQLPREICVTQNTGYTTTPLYINGITADETFIFVDDIISTGGTFEAINEGLKRKNHIKAGFFILDKGTRMKQLSQQTHIPLHSLLWITIKDNQVHIYD